MCVCRCYARAQLQNLPSCLKECWDLLSSEAFFLLLSNLTGLSLHALATGEDESDGEGQDGQSEGQDGQSNTDNGEDERNDPDGQGPSSTSSTEKKTKGGQTFLSLERDGILSFSFFLSFYCPLVTCYDITMSTEALLISLKTLTYSC